MKEIVCQIEKQTVPICVFAQPSSRWRYDPSGSLLVIGCLRLRLMAVAAAEAVD
jgi:hypothetical protein